jgi:hypothetical protein
LAYLIIVSELLNVKIHNRSQLTLIIKKSRFLLLFHTILI